MFYRAFFLTAIVLLYVTACGSTKSGERCLTASTGCPGVTDQTGSVAVEPELAANFRCDAIPSPNIVNANEALSLLIKVTGGSAPFSVPEAGIPAFGGSTTIYGSYYNNTGSDRVVSRSLTVIDAMGRVATCGFSVTVKSLSTTSGLACNIETTPVNPKQNQQVDFTITATGGTGTYEFSDLYLQANWFVAPTIESNGVAKASVKYLTAGTRTASIKVANNGKVSTCTEVINVSSVDLKVIASPSSRVRSNEEITLKANLNGFSTTSTKTFTFETTEPGISVIQDTADPSIAKVKSTDSGFHAFKVKVSVTSSEGETATPVEAPLVIGSEIASSCTLNVSGGSYTVNSPVTFSLSCAGGVKILDFRPGFNAVELASACIPGPGVVCPAVIVDRDTTRIFKYLSPGIRYVSAKIADNLWINNIVEIRNPIGSCSVSTNPNPSIQNGMTVVQTRFAAPIEAGTYDVTISAVGSNQAASDAIPNNNDILNKKIIYTSAGSYVITSTVKDRLTGQQVTCTSTHLVAAANGLLASAYRIPGYQRDHRFRLSSVDWDCLNHINNFFPSNIDVSARKFTDGFPGVRLSKWELYWFAIRYQGFINVPVTGYYDFQVMSDDGAILKIGGQTVINRDGLNSPGTSNRTGYFLTAGVHSFSLDYFQGPIRDMGIQLLWKKPGDSSLRIIESGAFSH